MFGPCLESACDYGEWGTTAPELTVRGTDDKCTHIRNKTCMLSKKKILFFPQTYITKVDRSLCCRICTLRNGVIFAALTGWNFPSDVRRKWEVQWSRARSMQTRWRRCKTPINLWQNSRQTRANEERVFMWKKSPSQGPQQPKSCLVL